MADKYSPQQALELIRKILNEGGYFVVSKHCRRESMREDNVDRQDIEILLLESGRIEREPEWDREHQNYKYRVEGLDDYGDELVVIVVIEGSNRLKIVTVF